MASKKHQPTKEQIGEAVDTLAKWFPEDAASFKRHRSAIVNHIYEGTDPSSDSELSTLKLQKSQIGFSSQVEAFSLPERSQLGVSSQMEAFSLPELTPCQEACGYVAVDVVLFVIDLVGGLHIPLSKNIK